VPVADTEALGKVSVVNEAWQPVRKATGSIGVYAYTALGAPGAWRVRFFAPDLGVPEDPATGSANCALAGLLAHQDPARDGTFHWRIAQGVEMGRPSLLEASADKRDAEVVTTRIGGTCVLVGEGRIEVD